MRWRVYRVEFPHAKAWCGGGRLTPRDGTGVGQPAFQSQFHSRFFIRAGENTWKFHILVRKIAHIERQTAKRAILSGCFPHP
jgi:hypothetical protein